MAVCLNGGISLWGYNSSLFEKCVDVINQHGVVDRETELEFKLPQSHNVHWEILGQSLSQPNLPGNYCE